MAIPAPVDPGIGDDKNALIAGCSNQAPEALAEAGDGIGDLVVLERIATLLLEVLDAGFHHRLSGIGKGQPGDNQHFQQITGQVDAFPEAGRTQENSPGIFTEGFQQVPATAAAKLGDQPPLGPKQPGMQDTVNRLYLGIGSKQNQEPPLDPVGQIVDQLCQLPGILGIGNIHRGIPPQDHALLVVVKGRRKLLLHYRPGTEGLIQTHLTTKVVKTGAHLEGGRTQHRTRPALKELGTEKRAHHQWCALEYHPHLISYTPDFPP